MMDAVFITARLKSTRLPRKVLEKIKGKPLLSYQIDRLRHNSVQDIIICTSINSQDDPLEDLASELGVRCYRGSEEDVLDRYLSCADQFSVERAYIIYADEPFIDIHLLQQSLIQLNSSEPTWVRNDKYPDGVFGYGFTRKALDIINATKSSEENEVWGEMVSRMPIKIISNEPPYSTDKYSYRLTVDYPEDLQAMKKLMLHLGDDHCFISIPDLLKVYEDLELFNINGFRSENYHQRLRDQAV